MRQRKTLYGPVGGRLIALAILALLAATLFSYQRFSSTRVVEAQASRPPRKTRGKLETQARAPIFASSFKHLSAPVMILAVTREPQPRLVAIVWVSATQITMCERV